MKKTVSILALTGILLTASVQAMDPQQWPEGGNDQATQAHLFPHVGAPAVPPHVGSPVVQPHQFQPPFGPVERKPAAQQTREFFPSEDNLYKYCPIRAGFVRLSSQGRQWNSGVVRFALAPYFEDYKNELEQGQKEALAQAFQKGSESWERCAEEHIDRILEETYQEEIACVPGLKKTVKMQEQKIKHLEIQRKQGLEKMRAQVRKLQNDREMSAKVVAEREKRIRAEHEEALKAVQAKLEGKEQDYQQEKAKRLQNQNRLRGMWREAYDKNQLLEKKLEETTRERDRFEEQLKEQHYKLKEEHEKSNSLRPDLEKAQKSNAGLIASRDQLIKEKGQLELALREKAQELKSIQLKQRKAEEKIGEYAGTNDALSAANNDLRQRVKELEQARSAPVKKQSSAQRAEFNLLQEAYKALQGDHERLVRGHKEAEEAFKQKMRKMNQKLSIAVKQSKDAEKLRAENETLSAECEKLMGEYQQLKSGGESKDAEMLVQKLKAEKAEKDFKEKMGKMSQDLRKAVIERRDATMLAQRLRAEKVKLSAQYEKLMGEYQQLKSGRESKELSTQREKLMGEHLLRAAKESVEASALLKGTIPLKEVADLQARLPRS